MNNRIIDASKRFLTNRPNPAPTTTVETQWDERSNRQKREAAELRATLSSTARLNPADRRIIARNLGRAIERKHDLRPTQIVAQLFRTVYGEEGGASREKKRKRYVRFDGESLSDQMNGEELAANGRDFLKLAEALAVMLDPTLPRDQARDQMLLFVCDGASFYGPSRPRLQQDLNLFERFRQTTTGMIDRIVRETDIIEYLTEAQNFTIKSHPEGRNDVSPDTLAGLHHFTWPVERFEHLPDQHSQGNYDEYYRLKLGGFDIKAEGPSGLMPRMRLARIYWPQQVLCLPAHVDTEALRSIRTRNLTKDELNDALDAFRAKNFSLDEEEHRIEWIFDWRQQKELAMWQDALRVAGFDPHSMDWAAFESSLSSEAQQGALWRTYWETLSVDLHLVADGQPDALHFGLSIGGGVDGHWTTAPKSLLSPTDDDKEFEDRNFAYYDPSSAIVPWYQDREKTYVARGFRHEHFWFGDEVNCEIETVTFGSENPPIFDDLMLKCLWPIHSGTMWNLLTLRMENWQENTYSWWGAVKKNDEKRPYLRPLFDAPAGWTPAPDGSLASAILRSLAYGDGSERLDDKFIAQVNNLVRCFRDMKGELSQEFDAALQKRDYIADS